MVNKTVLTRSHMLALYREAGVDPEDYRVETSLPTFFFLYPILRNLMSRVKELERKLEEKGGGE